MSEKRKTVTSNMLWRFFERTGAQGVTFIVSIVLARLLDPTVYGTVALVSVFTVIMQVFVDSGMGNALIQKKDADDLDFSSVFYFNIIMCTALYLAMFFAAPLIAGFYRRPELVPLIRVLSLTLVISGVKNIQQAYVSRNMLFKRFFFSTLGGTVGAAVIGIWMAYRGYGVWALVAQNLFNTTVDTIILWITVKWRPKRMFSLERLKGLFSYGWKLLISSLIETGYQELRSLLIGKKYTSADLAFYNKGETYPKHIIANINSSINSVLFPTLSKEQDDKTRVRNMTSRAIKISTYIMAPLMIGLAFISEPLVRLLLTEKWLPCVPFMRIFCVTYLFYPINTANLAAISAMGRSDIFLKLEIIKKVIGLTAIFITVNISVLAMGYSLLVTCILCQMINAWPNRRLLDYKYTDQMKDILPNILLAVFMGGCVYCVSLLKLPDALTIIMQIILGAGIYYGGSRILKLESYGYLIRMIRQWRDDRKAPANA